MGHFSTYAIVLLTILGSHQASGVQCYGESGAPEKCAGVCGTMTALEDGTNRDGQQVRKGGTKDNRKSLDEFKYRWNSTTDLGVSCTRASEKSNCKLVSTLAPSSSIGYIFFILAESETGCLPDTGIIGCTEKLFAGIHTRVCVCTTNFCNNGGGIRVKRDEGTTGETPTSSKNGPMIGGIVGGVALIVLICLVCCCCKCCNSKTSKSKSTKNIIFKA